jgi:lipoate synthase
VMVRFHLDDEAITLQTNCGFCEDSGCPNSARCWQKWEDARSASRFVSGHDFTAVPTTRLTKSVLQPRSRDRSEWVSSSTKLCATSGSMRLLRATTDRIA